MSQPVKLSDELILDARITSELAERSIAGQIEFWARLGRALERIMNGDTALALKKSGDAQQLSKLISTVDSPAGRERLETHLNGLPFPHYEVIPDKPNMILRTESNGNRAIGRFVKKEFQVIEKLKPAQGTRKKKK